LLCKTKNNVAKFTDVKTGWSNSRQVRQNILRKVMDQKGLFFSDDDDDDDDGKRLSYYSMFACTYIKEVLGRTNHLTVLSVRVRVTLRLAVYLNQLRLENIYI
jgi:hypothetical protein